MTLLDIRVLSRTRLAWSQEQGAASGTDNFTQALRSKPNGSCREPRGKCTREESRTRRKVIADQIRQGCRPPRLSSPRKLREPPKFKTRLLENITYQVSSKSD